MTVEHTDLPGIAPPVSDVYHHAAGRRAFGGDWPRTASTLLGM